MKSIAILSLLMAATFAPTPHEFEAGFVERTMSIVVRNNTAYMEYSIGLNQATVEELLQDWERNETTASKPTDSKTPQSKSAQPVGNRDLPVTSPLTTTQKPDLNSQNTDKPSDSANDSSGIASDTIPDEPTVGSHEITPKVMKRFRKLALAEIPKRIGATLDGQEIVFEKITEGIAPRHPFTMQILLQFQIPDSKPSQTHALRILDENFTKQTGAVRYSLKTTGRAMLMQSNVAPILVRSERVELKEFSAEQRKKLTCIDARIAHSPSSQD